MKNRWTYDYLVMGLFDNLKILLANNRGKTPSSQSNTGTDTSNKRVLIVEDKKILADALEMKFRHSGFEVIRAENGKIGLDMTRSDPWSKTRLYESRHNLCVHRSTLHAQIQHDKMNQ